MTTLLIACTKTKRQRPAPEMMMRARCPDTVDGLASAWLKDATRQPRYRPDELYGGQGWQDARQAAKEWDARFLVVSAAFGLLEPETRIPAYEATFASGEDRVADRVVGSGSPGQRHRTWYQQVNSRRLPDERIVATLGTDYVQALLPDLESIADPDRLLLLTFGPTLPDALEACRLPVGSELRNLLSVPMSRLGTRTLLWLATTIAPRSGEDFAELRKEVGRLEASRGKPTPIRRRLDDEEVSSWIRARVLADPKVNKTALLTRLRQEGVACEQSRFAHLFGSVSKGLDD